MPVIIGKSGVEKIEEVSLDDNEKKEFMHSIDAVKAFTASIECMNSFFSLSSKLTSSIFSTPLFPMITGTPA